ncbi:alpha/beta hydrolase [Rhodopirellula baltica]
MKHFLFLTLLIMGCTDPATQPQTSATNQPPSPVEPEPTPAPWGGLKVQFVGQPLPDAKQIVVMLHGYGASQEDLIPLGEYIGVEQQCQVYPEAPISVPDGGFAWATEDAHWESSTKQIIALIEELHDSNQDAKIAVGGFSQGATLASLLAKDPELPVDDLFLYSPAWLEFKSELPDKVRPDVLLAHGRFDQVLPFFDAKEMLGALLRHDANVNWIPFNDGHTIPKQVVDATRDKLQR